MLDLDDLVAGDLRIDATLSEAPPAVRLAWQGKSNARQADQLLLPYLERALGWAVERGVVLELHFAALGHFNSSTIASVIQLIQLAQLRGARLLIVFDPRRQWQRLSFDALKVFVRPDGLFELRTVEGP
jgi:hypothetical protein